MHRIYAVAPPSTPICFDFSDELLAQFRVDLDRASNLLPSGVNTPDEFKRDLTGITFILANKTGTLQSFTRLRMVPDPLDRIRVEGLDIVASDGEKEEPVAKINPKLIRRLRFGEDPRYTPSFLKAAYRGLIDPAMLPEEDLPSLKESMSEFANQHQDWVKKHCPENNPSRKEAR